MQYQEGQGLLGRIRFRDGEYPQYNRPYLIVRVGDDVIGTLNVSSTKGKEAKAAFPSNYPLKQFAPPFAMDSFVKLDSYCEISYQEANQMRLLAGGRPLNTTDLQEILVRMQEYKDC